MDTATIPWLVSAFDNELMKWQRILIGFRLQICGRAQNICERYPDYRFNISGIGESPPESDEKLGKCSQMVCFVRVDILENDSNSNDQQSTSTQDCTDVPFPVEKFPYKLLSSKPFPFDQDSRSVEEKIMDDVKYFINRHLTADDPYFNEEKDLCVIPLKSMLPFVHDVAHLNELRAIVLKEFPVNEHDCIEHKLVESSDFEQSDDDDNNDDDHDDYQQNASNQQNYDFDDESWD